MKIKKLNRKKNSSPKNLIGLIQTIRKYCSKDYKKGISEVYLGLCRKAIVKLFCENSKRLKDINYFCNKNFILGV